MAKGGRGYIQGFYSRFARLFKVYYARGYACYQVTVLARGIFTPTFTRLTRVLVGTLIYFGLRVLGFTQT